MGKPINPNQPKTKKMSKVEELTLEVERLRGAIQINQMLLQQASKSIPAMKADLDEFIGRQRDIQYRLLAYEELSGISKDQLEKEVVKLQLKDFEDLNSKDDEAKGLVPHPENIVDEDSVVVITTKTPKQEEDEGILRSKLEINQLPEDDKIKLALLGTKPGEEVTFEINGVEHVATILDIKKFTTEEVAENE